jgi:transposase-like protein
MDWAGLMSNTAAMLNWQSLMDDATCFATGRAMRGAEGVRCPHCESPEITKQRRDETQPERQRYPCKSCERRFDDLPDTLFAGHHQPLRLWILCSYLMGLTLSKAPIAQELDLHKDAAHHMTTQLRQGIVSKTPSSPLSGEVECDEVYLVAGHKGQPDEVAKQGAGADDGDSKAHGEVARWKARSHRSSA